MTTRDYTSVSRQQEICPILPVKVVLVLALLLAGLFLGSGCNTLDTGAGKNPAAAPKREYREIEGGGWLSVFLNLQEYEEQKAVLEIGSIELRQEDSWILFSETPRIINTGQPGSGQLLLARNMVTAGTVTGIRFSLNRVEVHYAGQTNILTPEESRLEFEFPESLEIQEGDSHSLFVIWNVRKSIQEMKAAFIPDMKISLQAIPLLTELLFLACPDIETVYVLRTDVNRVISSLGIEGRPLYLEADAGSDMLYILAAGANVIKVVDLKTFRVVDEIILVLDFEPAYMFFDPGRNFAYVIDQKGRSIARVNIREGIQEARINVSFEPEYGIYVEDRNLIAVSGSDTNKVYLFSPQTLAVISSISVNNRPSGLLVRGEVLYIAESDSNTVAAYDLRGGNIRNRVNVGFSPRRLLLKDQRIYITNFLSGSVSTMFTGQFNISGEIVVYGRPLEMAVSESRSWLYVTDLQAGGIHVIDSTSNRLNYFIDLETPPGGMSVIN